MKNQVFPKISKGKTINNFANAKKVNQVTVQRDEHSNSKRTARKNIWEDILQEFKLRRA